MRTGITAKLFWVLLSVCFAVVVLAQLLNRAAFEYSFRAYVGEREQQQLALIAPGLELYYERFNSWQKLAISPMRWQHWLRRQLRTGQIDGAPPPPGYLRDFTDRLTLLDDQGQVVLGHPDAPDNPEARRHQLGPDEAPYGWLVLTPPPPRLLGIDQSFAQHHSWTLLAISLLCILLAALGAALLARRLLLPIRELAAATRDLANGDYQRRIATIRQDELGALATDFNRLAATLADNERLRRDWMADIAHELRTPITILKGELEALEDGVRPLTPNAIEALQHTLEPLEQRVEDLHQFSLTAVGSLSYRFEEVNLNALCLRTLTPLMSRLHDAGLPLSLEMPEFPLWVRADPRRLEQLLLNLIGNSQRYTDRPGAVLLKLGLHQQQVVLELYDTPPGVPTEQLQSLFQRFYRRSEHPGSSGLGLTICQQIVEAHEGQISAHPSPLGGLLIRVELPQLPEEKA